MPKRLIPLAVLALLLVAGATTAFAVGSEDDDDDSAAITSADGIAPGECSLVHNVEACEGGGSAEPAPGQPPITSIDEIDPNECNLVHNLDACSPEQLDGAGIGVPNAAAGVTYDVSVTFSTSVTQADIDAVAALLSAYDGDGSFLLQESFPPVGRARLTSDAPDFCGTLEAELEASPGVADASCRAVGKEPITVDPDEPVTSGELVDPDECSLVHNIDAC